MLALIPATGHDVQAAPVGGVQGCCMKALIITGLLVVSPLAWAQHKPADIKHYGRQPRTTTPLQCEQNPHPGLRHFCESIEVVAISRRDRVPMSRRILLLPDLLTRESGQLGYACSEGYAIEKTRNGWQQVNDSEHQPVRCRVPR
ncbi:hypothetical protein [Luteimonas sp. e5]